MEAVLRDLDAALAARANARAHAYWTGLMKGEARFRGVPMAGVRDALGSVWATHRLGRWSTEALLHLALRWFAAPESEDKLAAVLLLAERIPERLRLEHAEALAAPFSAGHVQDWNVTDWMAVKALHAFLVHGDELPARSRALAGWTEAPGLWQRRAGLVAFVKLAPRSPEPFAGFTELVLEACARNLRHEGRFAHTGPGWVLRELSKAAPDAVAAFAAAHPEMTAEARRMATAHLRPGPYRRR